MTLEYFDLLTEFVACRGDGDAPDAHVRSVEMALAELAALREQVAKAPTPVVCGGCGLECYDHSTTQVGIRCITCVIDRELVNVAKARLEGAKKAWVIATTEVDVCIHSGAMTISTRPLSDEAHAAYRAAFGEDAP